MWAACGIHQHEKEQVELVSNELYLNQHTQTISHVVNISLLFVFLLQ